jgi:hypothetical protein
MSKRVCYSYHPTTFLYQGLESAYECQIEKGVYILPDHSTFIAPPSPHPLLDEYYMWTGEEWVCKKKMIREIKTEIENDPPPAIEEPLQDKILNLMNARQELLRETQELLHKYKFFSQEVDKLWFEYNNSQLQDDT